MAQRQRCEIRTLWATNERLLAATPPEPGWTPAPSLIQAAGDVSAAFPVTLARVAPMLDGLEQRLGADNAAFRATPVCLAFCPCLPLSD